MPLTERAETNWAGVAFGWLLTVLAAYQQFKLPPVLPLMIDRYGYEPTVAGGFMSIYALAGLLLSVRLGRLIQARGAAGFLHAAFALLLAGNLWALLAPGGQWGVLAARGLEGVSFAVLAVAGHTLMTASAGPGHAALTASLAATWIPVGQVAAGLGARPLAASGHWQPLWWAGVALTVALALWTGLLDARTRAALGPRRPDRTEPAPVASPAQQTALALAAAVFGLWSAQYVAYVTWLPEYLVRVHGFDPAAAAGAYMMSSIALIICALVAGRMLRSGVGPGRLLACSMAVQALVWLLLPWTDGGWKGALSLIAYGVAAGGTATGMFALPGAILGHGRVGAGAMGVLMTGRNLGVLIGPVLLAAVFVGSGGWNPAALLFGSATLVSTAACLWLTVSLRRLAG